MVLLIVGAQIGVVLLVLVVSIAFAVAVYADADDYNRRIGPTKLVSPVIWGLGTFLTGIVGGSLYWLVHYGGGAERAE